MGARRTAAGGDGSETMPGEASRRTVAVTWSVRFVDCEGEGLIDQQDSFVSGWSHLEWARNGGSWIAAKWIQF